MAARSAPNAFASTAALWRRLARPMLLGPTVDALFGLSPEVVHQLAAMTLCTSDEARALLHGMPNLVRSLTTSVQATAARSRGEIRGPVLWSETISARAASFGDPDLFVCTTPQRDYDTAENRVLVHALSVLGDAGRTIEHVGEHDDPILRAARDHGRAARRYLEHPVLAQIPTERPRPRAVKRARGGKSAVRYRPALDVLERAAEPLDVADLLPYCDRRTRLQHDVLHAVLEDLEHRGLRVPALRAEAGALLAGPVTYIHPRRVSGPERLHGVLVGDVLVDVPERARETNRARALSELAARSHGRTAVLVTGVSEVPAAVDLAVRNARDVLGGATSDGGRLPHAVVGA
jgi:hypothetical protein